MNPRWKEAFLMNDKKPPMGKPPMGKPSLDMATVKRLLSYFKNYRISMVFVFLCIVLGTVASVASSLFIKTLIDDYITPLVGAENPDFLPLIGALAVMATIYVIGILSTLFYNRTMAKVSQNILKDIRSSMFRHMQRLPIKYFDTHTHGDVMSYYTNDADALRQMLSQSIPQVIQSVLTITFVFISMLIQSIWLTAFVIVFTFFMMKLLGKITGKSGHYFMEAQRSVAGMNGYIEEMINGQKVVKVFNHEEKAKESFDFKNTEL